MNFNVKFINAAIIFALIITPAIASEADDIKLIKRSTERWISWAAETQNKLYECSVSTYSGSILENSLCKRALYMALNEDYNDSVDLMMQRFGTLSDSAKLDIGRNSEFRELLQHVSVISDYLSIFE